MSNTPVPPQNLEAEESVLGAMMLGEGVTDNVLDVGLKAEDFYRGSHGTLFRAMCAMHAHNVSIDAITVVDHLEVLGALEAAGGKQRIHELAALVPATANVRHYARIVQKTGTLRRLISTGQEIARLGWEQPGELPELIGLAEEALTRAVMPAISSQFESALDAAAEVVQQIEDAIASGKPRMGMSTGFIDLDNELTGLHGGRLYLLAARPAMGKSALALNIAENAADADVPVAFSSLEMSRDELVIRSLSRLSGIDSKKLQTARLAEHELTKFREAHAAFKKRAPRFFIEDAKDTTISKLRVEAKRLKRTKGLGVLVVDYLQLMLEWDGKGKDNTQAEISAISRQLKLLAGELNIPVLALSQLNRQLENRPEKRPQLSDLRDSGALEQNADVVLFIYRDEYYNKDSTDLGVAEVIVGKNRHGSTGTVKLAFSARTTTFKNLARGLEGSA